MTKSILDEHYEEKFEFPLWKLIKEYAEEKDISYLQASEKIVPEYVKTIRYRDVKFEESEVKKREKEMIQLKKNKV